MKEQTQYCCVRSLHESDLSALADLLTCNGAEEAEKLYGLVPQPDDLRRQIFSDPDYDPQLVYGIFSDRRLVGTVAGVRRPWKNGLARTGFIKWLQIHPAHRHRGLGTTLLESIQRKFTEAGMQEIRFGGSAPRYLLPGVPANAHGLISLLKKHNWELTTQRINLCVDLNSVRLPQSDTQDKYDITEVMPDNRGKVLDFIENEFSTSWAIEAEDVFRSAAPAFLLQCSDNSGTPVGFAAVGATNRNWLGPMGVAEKFRGQGIGRRLLSAALVRAGQRSIEHLCIPWAEEEFYRGILGGLPRTVFIKAVKKL